MKSISIELQKEAEKFVSDLVVGKVIFAKMDR
jgi:hypothetical protein